MPEKNVCSADTPTFSSEHSDFVRKQLQQLMKGAARPTAIFCTFDTEAEVVFFELAAMGIKVPGDVSLVGFGGRWREGPLARRLVSVTVDEEELARKAVNLLHEMRRKERSLDDVTEVLLPLELSQGETLADI